MPQNSASVSALPTPYPMQHEGLYLNLPSLNCISVDPATGSGHFKLLLARLGDEEHGAAFELAISSACCKPCISLLPVGTWSQSFKMLSEWDGRQADWDYTLKITSLPHSDGRSINATLNNHGRDEGPGFVLDAETFVQKRLAFVNSQEAGDRRLSEAELDALSDAQLQARQEQFSYFKEIDDCQISLIAKSGIAQIFDCVGTGKAGSNSNILLTHFVPAVGRTLTFTWDRSVTPPRLTAIDDDIGRLVSVTWTSDHRFCIKIYPDSAEQKKYDCSIEDKAWAIEVRGADPLAEKQVYRIDTSQGRINGVELKTHYRVDEKQETVRVDSEALTYKDGKITCRSLSLASGLVKECCEYAYEENKTTQVFKRDLQTLTTHVQEFEDGRLVASTVTSGGVTTVSRQAVTVDEVKGTVTLTTTHAVGEQDASKSSATFDAMGNLVQLSEGNQITEWSYYNNYKHYEVEEWRTVKHEPGFSALLYKALCGVMFSDVLPLRLGSESGLTSSIWTLSSVRASASACDYAKQAFNLPVDLKYPGDFYGFSTHVESEKISRIADGQTHVEQVTYFGYRSLDCAPRKGLSRTHVIVPKVKLTVLDPDLETIDLVEIQQKIAEAAAQDWLNSLDKQIAKAHGDDEKKAYQAMKANLKESLKAQSKLNATGFKLKSLKASRIQVEELEYQTDPARPGYGQVNSQTLCLLDQDGKEVSDSKTVTSLQYSADATDNRKASVTTTLKCQDVELTTRQTRAGFAGLVLETVDSKGIENTWTIAKNGLVKDEQISHRTKTMEKVIYSTTLLDRGLFRYQAIDSQSGAGERVVVDGLGREHSTEVSWDGKNWLLWTEFGRDEQGRRNSIIEYDYNATDDCQFVHSTSWHYNEATGSCTITRILEGADGVEIDRSVDIVSSDENGITCTNGLWRQHRHYDPKSRSLTLTQGNTNGEGAQLKQQILFAADGLPRSSTTTSVTGKTQDKIQGMTFGFNSNGLLSNLKMDSGQQYSYEYDRFGRPTMQDNNGIVIRNQYSPNSLSSAATATSIEGGDDHTEATMLGKQTIDGLGRVKTRTVNDTATRFRYEGAESWGATNEADGPGVLDGYSSSWDENTLTYTETCPLKVTRWDTGEWATTSTRYTRRGRLLTITDLLGYITTYSYDVHGRVAKLSNACCETSFSYTANGLLSQEVVNDLTSDCRVTVTYRYDVMGNELSRTFESPGMATHTLSRELLADGRLKASVLTVNGVKHSSNTYVYDVQGRMTDSVAHNSHNILLPLNTKYHYDYDVLGNIETVEITRTPHRALSLIKLLHRSGARPPFDSIQRRYAIPSTELMKRKHETPLNELIKREYATGKPGLLSKHNDHSIKGDNQGRWSEVDSSLNIYAPNGQLQIHSGTSANSPLYCYEYNNIGRLCMLTRSDKDSCRGYQYHYRDGKIYARTQRTIKLVECQQVEQRVLALLNDSPSCLLQVSREDGGNTANSFELRDAAGTVFATVSNQGTIKYHYYTPYGDKLSDDTTSHLLGFKGEAVLPDGTYYLGSRRVYDPRFMCFQVPDSWSPFDAGGPASYAYCGGDPVNYHDPSGHQMVAHYQRQEALPAMYTKEFRIGMAVAGVVMAPLTGGASLQMTIAITGLAAVSAGFEIASIMTEESDPQLSKVMGFMGFAFGMSSLAAGFAGIQKGAASAITSRSARLPFKGKRGAMAMGGAIEDINPLDKEIHYIVDTHKGGKRISITGHGVYDDFLDTWLMAGENTNYTPSKLLSSMKSNGIDPQNFDHVRLLMCSSADATSKNESFAATFARLAKKNVKAYHGKVHVSWSSEAVTELFQNPPLGVKPLDWITKQRTAIISSGNFRQVVRYKHIRLWKNFLRRHPNPNYKPEVFSP